MSYQPFVSICFDLDVRTVCPHDHGARFVGAKDLGAHPGQRPQDIHTRMAVLVPGTDRNYSDIRVNGSEKGIARAGGASVMTDFQYVGPKLVSMPFKKPILFRAFCITDKQKSHHPVTHNGDSAGEVWIF